MPALRQQRHDTYQQGNVADIQRGVFPVQQLRMWTFVEVPALGYMHHRAIVHA